MQNVLGPHTDYQVRIPIYEGPLDLLLNLIEKAELDITTVSLAMVTDQYLAYMHGLEQSNPDDMSGFLIIAARLLQIKSEALLPRPRFARVAGPVQGGSSLRLSAAERQPDVAWAQALFSPTFPSPLPACAVLSLPLSTASAKQ